MFLSKDEKALVLLWRIEDVRHKTLWGQYDYSVGEKEIRNIKNKLEKMGYNPDAKIMIV